MPWMRVSIGMGGLATVAGIAGMLLWIHDGSHYFDLAVAVAMAGFLTLVSCVLTRVFGSSHGSQDDAFRRGKSMGYDEGFLEGHRSARPVVVPLRSVERELEATVSGLETAAEPEPQAPSTMAPSTMAATRMAATRMAATGMAATGMAATAPRWRRDSRNRADGWGRMIPWARARRTPLLVGIVSLGLLCALGISELRRPTAATEALQQSPGKLFYQAVPPLGSTPLLVRRTGQAPARLAGASGVSPVAPPVAPGPSVLPTGESVNPLGLPAAMAAPGTSSQPVVASPGTAPAAVPVSEPVQPTAPVAPVVPLTAAEQTAANAKAAADLTAANAAAAAAETARVAAAAAEATRLQALADAYAVAHPAG